MQSFFDISLHALGALIYMGLAIPFSATGFAAVTNALFWFTREAIQDINKGHFWPDVWPFRKSMQKWLEAGIPAVVGFIIWSLS